MTNWQKFVLIALAIAGASAMLSGCGGSSIIRDRVTVATKPVAQPCVAESGRPDSIISLKQEFPDANWRAMDVRQKAAAVSVKGLQHKKYGEDLDAATGACP